MSYNDELIKNKILITIQNLIGQSPWNKTITYDLLISNLDKSITSHYNVFAYLSILHQDGFIEIKQKHNFFTLELLDKGKHRIHMMATQQDFSFKKKSTSIKNSFFLSHSSYDKEFVNRLALDLSNQNLHVFFDKWEINVGDSIVEKINMALESMKGLIIVLSSNSVTSNWVKKELSSALIQSLSDNSISIYPVLIEYCNIPLIIKDLKYADFVSSYENGFIELINSILSK
jgi:hypothetical protein